MRLASLSGTCLLSLVISGAFAACGSDDGKKKAPVEHTPGGQGGGATDRDNSSGAAGLGVVGGAPDNTSAGGEAGVPGGAAAGGAGGEASTKPFHGVYIGTKGDDTADGTEAAPFKTLDHAASLARAGDTIVFLDGSFAMGSQAVAIAEGVEIMAQNAGKATLTGGGVSLFSLAGDARLSGLEFSGQQTVVAFAAGADATGTVSIDDSSFVNCTSACLALTGSVKAVVTSPSGAVVGNGGGAFATLAGASSLSLSGGILQNYQAAGIVRATDDASVDLSDFEVQDGTGTVLSLDKQATGNVDGATISTLSQVLFKQLGTSELSVNNSDLSMKPNATAYECFDLEMQGVGKLSIDTTTLHGCGTGLKGAIPGELELLDSEFYDLAFGGSDLVTGGPNLGGTVVVDGCQFHDVGNTAMRIGDPNSLLNLRMRNTTINVTTIANWDALILNGLNTSVIDLGTLAEPGGNTFIQGLAANATAVRIQLQAVTVQAVGNTWTPSAQGADAQGHYSVTSGKVLDITAAVSTGINYTKPYATTTLRLAQIP